MPISGKYAGTGGVGHNLRAAHKPNVELRKKKREDFFVAIIGS